MSPVIPQDKTPSAIALRRSFEITDALMHGLNDEGHRLVLQPYLHGQRYPKSHQDTEEKKTDDSRNLGFGEMCKLPNDCERMEVSFRMRVLPLPTEPETCDEPIWHNAFSDWLRSLPEQHRETLDRLAVYYACNLLNGSWLWRNRLVSDEIEVRVVAGGETFSVADARNLPSVPVEPGEIALREIDSREIRDIVSRLSGLISEALRGKRKCLDLQVSAILKILPGQMIWPSQVYNPVEEKRGYQRISRRFVTRLNEDEEMTAAMTAEKIGNALRTFDAWHGNTDFPEAVISVEPNGGSLRYAQVLRGERNNFYGLIRKAIAGKDLSPEDLAYLLGVCIRGGVFNLKTKDVKNRGRKKKETVSDSGQEGA